MQPFASLMYVGKYLRAIKGDVLRYGAENYNLTYDPFEDTEEISAETCFALLMEFTEDYPNKPPICRFKLIIAAGW